ncbi:MAG: MBL fold metallo-hydrolase [Bacteroidales bacterium]|nr:MBL fold metallo-hydrolase [Bacteroidales bacterium]
MGNSLTFLGTGSSLGIPIICCSCPVCASADSRDRRSRSAVYVRYEGLGIIVDAGPDFRSQLIRENVRQVDAILLTHNHKDHTGGLDDVRALNYYNKSSMPVYCESYVQQSLKREYAYAFDENPYPGAPSFLLETISEQPFYVKGVEIVPIRAYHASLPVLGFRFGPLAYITDASAIPESEFAKLQGVEVFVINAIQMKHHKSHFSLPEALEVVERVGAKRSFITHISHMLPSHAEMEQMLPAGVSPAWDGLTVSF